MNTTASQLEAAMPTSATPVTANTTAPAGFSTGHARRSLLAVGLLVLLCLLLLSWSHQRWSATAQRALQPQDALSQARIALLEAELTAERPHPDGVGHKLVLARLDSAQSAAQELQSLQERDNTLFNSHRREQVLPAAQSFKQAVTTLRELAQQQHAHDGAGKAALEWQTARLDVDDRARTLELALHHALVSDRQEQLLLTIGSQLALALLGVTLLLLMNQQERRNNDALAHLLGSEERLRAITSAIPDQAFVFDRQGRYLEVFGDEAKLAAPREHLLGKCLSHVMAPDLARLFETTLYAAIDDQSTRACEYPLALADGLHWFDSRVSAVPGQRTAVWVSWDVTERKRAELRAQDLTSLYRWASQVNQAIVWTRDEPELFQRVCEVAISHGHFRYAWVARWRKEGDLQTEVLAQAGDPALAALAQPLTLEPNAQHFLARALNEAVIQWQTGLAVPGQVGVVDAVALPLRDVQRYCTALVLVREHLDPDHQDERAVLADLAMDLSYALAQLTQAPGEKRDPQPDPQPECI